MVKARSCSSPFVRNIVVRHGAHFRLFLMHSKSEPRSPLETFFFQTRTLRYSMLLMFRRTLVSVSILFLVSLAVFADEPQFVHLPAEPVIRIGLSTNSSSVTITT